MDDMNNSAGFVRVPPNDVEAEQAVLSSMLFDREAVASAYEILKGDDFYRPENKAVFEAMIGLFTENVPVDAVTLNDKLAELGVLDKIGGRDYIVKLVKGSYTSANIKYHAKIVEEKAILRRLVKVSGEIANSSYEASDSVEAILDNAEKSIFNIAQNRNSGDFTHIKDVLVSSIDKIEEAAKSGGKVTGVPTGFIDLDTKTAGLQPSDLILVACRPSMGKSAFTFNIAQNAAIRQKIPTAIFSLEMSKEQVVNRLLSSEAMIDAQKMRTGELNDEDWTKIAYALSPMSEAPLYIDDTPGISVTQLRAKCRKLKLEKGLGLIIIDYLQLMTGSGSRIESRQQEISEISRSLKAVAREMNAPVIACSQLSRACESRTDHRPMLSDLRESGAIEQDADVVAFIYRDEYYHPDTEKKNLAEIIIAKQRNGPTGTVELLYLGNYTKFANMVKDRY